MMPRKESVLRAGSGFCILDIVTVTSLTKVGLENRLGMMILLPEIMGVGRGLGTVDPVSVVMDRD